MASSLFSWKGNWNEKQKPILFGKFRWNLAMCGAFSINWQLSGDCLKTAIDLMKPIIYKSTSSNDETFALKEVS